MLACSRVGLLTSEEAQTLVGALQQLDDDLQHDVWTVEVADEDVHSKIEALLIERIGEPGKKLHTGRSRNDHINRHPLVSKRPIAHGGRRRVCCGECAFRARSNP